MSWPSTLRRRTSVAASLALVGAQLDGRPATAELPDAATFLREIGFDADRIAQVEAGRFVEASLQASDVRELDAAFAFLVQTSPGELVKQLREGLLDRVDPNTIDFAMLHGTPSLASFAKLTLQPDAHARARAYVAASPGGDLNLSAEEIAGFAALGRGAARSAVENAVRSALLARLQAYQAKGLSGIAPYARSGGDTRSPAQDLRSATLATKKLQQLVPAAYQALLEYPNAKPSGMEKAYRWSSFHAHGVPTLSLTHTSTSPRAPPGWWRSGSST